MPRSPDDVRRLEVVGLRDAFSEEPGEVQRHQDAGIRLVQNRIVQRGGDDDAVGRDAGDRRQTGARFDHAEG